MRLSRRIAVPVVVAALCVAGCTGREPEVVEPSRAATGSVGPTPSVTPTPMPSEQAPEPPPPPPELASTDEAGAAAAAQYFVSLYAYTLRTGDVSLWEQMSHTECGFCAGIREDSLAAAARGEQYEGGEITLTNITVLERDDLIGGYPIDARYSQAPERLLTPTGEVASTTEANSGNVRIDTFRSVDGWKILAVVLKDT
jgi:hypothetical protein